MICRIDGDSASVNICQQVLKDSEQVATNLEWLDDSMHPLFFSLNQEEMETLSILASALHHVNQLKKIMLQDTPERTMVAQIDTPGSLYTTLRGLHDKKISYAELTTSRNKLNDAEHHLEVIRIDYGGKADSVVANDMQTEMLPETLVEKVTAEVHETFPNMEQDEAIRLLKMIRSNSPEYIRVSSTKRIARVLNLYTQTEENDGIFLDLQEQVKGSDIIEGRLLLGMANPPEKFFLVQLLEVLHRLGISVNRSYSLTVSNGVHPYFLSTFYVSPRDGSRLMKDSALYLELKREIYNTQILSPESNSYSELVEQGVTTGPNASLIDAFISFCHTNLAHRHPDVYSMEGIMRAFHNHPDISVQFIQLFHAKFSPAEGIDLETRKRVLEEQYTRISEAVENFNSGRKFLDAFRKTVFRCALSFVKFTLKTNFFVAEKHALSFRLDPQYLEDLGDEFTADLPADRPFRVTFFFGRNGCGYHIGFSDIARGGWRTIITEGRDDYITNANTMFKENYVLAHTQHLKNKDIYEGGSKLVAVLRVPRGGGEEVKRQQLYRLQFGFINAFFDLYVTENGHAKDPRVIDYYGEDEPIELGPDENMHNVMVETIARQGVKRGYILGKGVISSKEVGINHKEYGVTSIGVTRFAEVTMKSQGIDMHNDSFSVKLTGGPNGDVAGNCIRLIMERCPKAQIKLIIDGSGALFDPKGLRRGGLEGVVLKSDLDEFDPSVLHPGGFLLYRSITRMEGMTTLYKKVTMSDAGLEEEWISTDAFYRLFNSLLFTVKSDLFIPAGGRPETIDISNVDKYFDKAGEASARVIVEGANSFITPDARIELQRRGVVIQRDASANKCGVISSSYEIIANLMLSDDEFLTNKDCYVEDVIQILNQMAEREASLVIKRHNDAGGLLPYTEVSNLVSREINKHYAHIFEYFQANTELLDLHVYQNVMLLHMPKVLGSNSEFRGRLQDLPEKVKCAILASKLASSMVYEGDSNSIYGGMIKAQVGAFPEFVGEEC